MKLILIYTVIAGVISAITAPIPGTSLLLTALEIYMIVHLSKIHDYKLGLKEIGYSAAALYGVSTFLKDVALEILTFFPFIGISRKLSWLFFSFSFWGYWQIYISRKRTNKEEDYFKFISAGFLYRLLTFLSKSIKRPNVKSSHK